jgi:dATP pyrophosphohydrolase
MLRPLFQVAVLPFFRTSAESVLYAVLRRSDAGYWQCVAGGGEGDETPEAAARRESFEEIGVPLASPLFRLHTMNLIPVTNVQESMRLHWPASMYVIPRSSPAGTAARRFRNRARDRGGGCGWRQLPDGLGLGAQLHRSASAGNDRP